MVNPVPERLSELMVREPVPDEVSVTESALEVPVVTLPKLSEVALNAIWGTGATPVPESVTVEVAPLVELLTMVSLPVTEPAAVGAKAIGIASVWPGLSVLGSVVEAIENPVPLKVRELMVTAVVPDELRVTDNDLDIPSVTLPKLSEVALNVILGFATAAGTMSDGTRFQLSFTGPIVTA